MNVLIAYRSNTGHTEEYANLLARELECTVVPLNELSSVKLEDYDYLVFGGWVRASSVVGLNSFLKHIQTTERKKVAVFAVGANSNTEENTKELIEKNLTSKKISYPLFYMQGGFDPDKLNFLLRTMLQKVAKSIKKKQETSPETMNPGDIEFLEFFQEKNNHVSVDHLSELIAYIRN